MSVDLLGPVRALLGSIQAAGPTFRSGIHPPRREVVLSEGEYRAALASLPRIELALKELDRYRASGPLELEGEGELIRENAALRKRAEQAEAERDRFKADCIAACEHYAEAHAENAILTARVAELEGLAAAALALLRVYGWATANVPEDWDGRATAALEAQPKGETDE